MASYETVSSVAVVTIGAGGGGAVRIIWGVGRSYPNGAN